VERCEGAESVATQGPRDMAKAKLLEAQSPVVQAFTLCDTASSVAATGIRRLRVSSSQPFRPVDGRQRACLRGRTGTPTSRSIRPAQGEYGIAYGTRVLWRRSANSSRGSYAPPGRTGKPSTRRSGTGVDRSTGMVRYARCETPKPYWGSSHHDTGEPGAVISRTPGSEGGRRKRTNLTGTSSAAYPTARRVREATRRDPPAVTPAGRSGSTSPLYPQRSWEELEGRFLGPMAYLDAKARGNSSLPEKQRSCSGV
jgi:hypothetical protein